MSRVYVVCVCVCDWVMVIVRWWTGASVIIVNSCVGAVNDGKCSLWVICNCVKVHVMGEWPLVVNEAKFMATIRDTYLYTLYLFIQLLFVYLLIDIFINLLIYVDIFFCDNSISCLPVLGVVSEFILYYIIYYRLHLKKKGYLLTWSVDIY